MIESRKCLSGRAFVRVVGTGACGLGGKSPRAFGDEERIAGENATDVVLPSGVGAPLEVVLSGNSTQSLRLRLGDRN
jgi:hypothetical protein